MSSAIPSNHTLVNIGTHNLALYSHGPCPNNPQDPVVLFISGVASSSRVWAGVTRLLPSPLRSYTYDRSGCGSSEPSPLAPTAENIAIELSNLIRNAGISNPLILVGHSWAGVLVTEFLLLPDGPEIAGLVLVDANHETALQVLNPYDANLQAVFAGVEAYSAKGIAAEHKLTDGEWDAFLSDEGSVKFKLQEMKEHSEYAPSFETLRKKEVEKKQPLLGSRPVYIVGGFRSRDWGRMCEAGVKMGNGTEEQRSYVREVVRTADEKHMTLMERHLKLSTKGKLAVANESGHFVQLTQPECVVQGVEWVLENL